MDIQCLIEEAWARGDQTIDMSKTHLGFPYVINFSNLTQRWLTNGFIRSVRRVKQAPYPLVKVRLEELIPVVGRRDSEIRKSIKNVSQCGMPSKILTNNVILLNDCKKQIKKKTQKNKAGNETTPANLARAILNNLNIFGNKSAHGSQQQLVDNKSRKDSVLDADSSSTKSGRRPSLDTVSTYLSQESRESHRNASTADLLNCSASSDDSHVLESHVMPSIIGK